MSPKEFRTAYRSIISATWEQALATHGKNVEKVVDTVVRALSMKIGMREFEIRQLLLFEFFYIENEVQTALRDAQKKH